MKKPIAVLLLSGAACYAQAENINIDMKPGYWQNTIHFSEQSMAKIEQSYDQQVQQAMSELHAQLESMPAEQREMMENMMEAQGIEIKKGEINMPSMGLNISKEGIKSKSCVTAEDIKNGSLGMSDNEDCKTQIKQSSKSSLHLNQSCRGDDPSSMQAQIEFDKPTHYTGTGKMTQMIQGEELIIDVSLEGSWLAQKCAEGS